MSTAIWATWQPNVWMRMPSGFGPREPCPTSDELPSLDVISVSSWRSVPSRELTAPSARTRSDAAISYRSEASSSSWVRTSWAAERTAGATDASVIEPPDVGP